MVWAWPIGGGPGIGSAVHGRGFRGHGPHWEFTAGIASQSRAVQLPSFRSPRVRRPRASR